MHRGEDGHVDCDVPMNGIKSLFSRRWGGLTYCMITTAAQVKRKILKEYRTNMSLSGDSEDEARTNGSHSASFRYF